MSYAYAAKQAVPASTVPEGAPEGWPAGWPFPPPAYPPGWECEDVPALVSQAGGGANFALGAACEYEYIPFSRAVCGFGLGAVPHSNIARTVPIAGSFSMAAQPSSELVRPKPDVYSTQDATIFKGAPDGNNNLAWMKVAWEYSGGVWYPRRCLVQFDLSSFAGVVGIESAILKLYVTNYGNDSGISVEMWMARLNAAWVENQVTWNSRQTGTLWTTGGADAVTADRSSWMSTGIQYSGSGTPNAYVEIDVKQWVTDWLITGLPNYGILLAVAVESGTKGQYITMDTREAAHDPTLSIVGIF